MRKTWLDLYLLAAAALISALQFGLFPILFAPSWIDAGLFVLAAALTEPLHYGLMHESIHGNLLPDERWNRRAGRALGITLGLPWETMRFGHLAHHGFNRHDFDRPEALAPDQPRAIAAVVYYFKLVIGNAIAYAVAPILTVVPIPAMKWVLENVDKNPEIRLFAHGRAAGILNPGQASRRPIRSCRHCGARCDRIVVVGRLVAGVRGLDRRALVHAFVA